MPRRKPSDAALLATLISHQQRLPQSLNGTTQQARDDLAEAQARGLDLKDLAPLIKALEPPTSPEAQVIEVTPAAAPKPKRKHQPKTTPAPPVVDVEAEVVEPTAPAPATAAKVAAFYAEEDANRAKRAKAKKAKAAEPAATAPTAKAAEVEPEQVVDRSIDAEQAHRYLQLLAKDPKTTRLRAFAHALNPRKAEIRARKGPFNLKDAESWQTGERRVYCCVNDGGDTAASITSCIANYFEFDGSTRDRQVARIEAVPEVAAMIGMTVATREADDASLHSYFLLSEPVTDVWRWRLMQWRLIQLFGSDPSVEDPSRVMALPGAWYVLADGSYHSRSYLVEERTRGNRVSFNELEAAVAAAEEERNLHPMKAIPKPKRILPDVQDLVRQLFPGQRYPDIPESATQTEAKDRPFAQAQAAYESREKPWHRARTLDEVKEALQMMPPRAGGLETYTEDRLVMAGLAAALEELELPRTQAITLVKKAGWEGWNAEQVLESSSLEIPADKFWQHARKCGWKSKEERLAEEERIKRQIATAEFSSSLLNIHSQNLASDELTAALMTLAASQRQQLSSVRKAYEELLENEAGVERMTEALDLLSNTEAVADLKVADLVPAEFYRDVVQDFQKGFVIDELMVLMMVLTTMSSVLPIGTTVRLLDHTLHDQSVLLYLLVLMESGSRKTMLFDQLAETPILKSEIATRDRQTFERVRRWQAAEKAKRAKKAGKDAPEAEVAIQASEEGNGQADTSSTAVPISLLMHLVSDFTGEGVDRNCQQADAHYHHGFLLGTDEGRQLLEGDQYKGGASNYSKDKLTRMYDGKGNNQVRGDSRNERRYSQSHVAILGLTQPEIYDRISAEQADDESGFWPRFLTLQATPVELRKLSKEERKAACSKTYPDALKRLYNAANLLGQYGQENRIGNPPQFRFSEEAQDWWYERSLEIDHEQSKQEKAGDKVVARLLGKTAGQVGRLACLLHLLEAIVKTGYEGCPPKDIPLQTVKNAYDLQSRLLRRTITQRLRVHNGETHNDTQLLREVQSRCLEKDPDGKGLRLGAIERFWNQKNRPTKEMLYQAVTALAERGYGALRQGTGNRPGFVYTAQIDLPATS